MHEDSWRLLAQVYTNEEIDLSEVVKTMLIMTNVEMFDDEREKIEKIGYNLLDHSKLNDALVLGLLIHAPEGKPITYRELGEILKKHPQTVGGAVSRLTADGVVTKRDFGASGSIFTVHERMIPVLPNWILKFTHALMELHTDPELHARIEENAKSIKFKRGFEVLREELREKFYRPRKPKADKPD
jgi:DNA-binding transcriptional ArsR family regulator